MIFEHFALNIEKPSEMADWYVKNCGMKIVFSSDKDVVVRFLADKTGRVVAEIYKNVSQPVTDFLAKHPLEFHFAFMVKNAENEKNRLMQAGATLFEEIFPADGSHLVMLRDPFGMPLQLCQRANPMMKID